MRVLVLLFIILSVTAFLLWRFPYALNTSDDKMHLVYLLMLLTFLGAGASQRHKFEAKHVQQGLIWVALFVVLMLGYQFKGPLRSALMPWRAEEGTNGALSLHTGQDGHFYLEAEVNDVPVRFMVDTGASDLVLSMGDAARVGLTPAELQFTRTYQTANGPVGGAPVTIREFHAGSLIAHNLPASVNQGQMDGSLLGMRFLSRFGKLRIEGDTLTLEP